MTATAPVQTTAQVRDRIASLTVDDAVIASAILAEISAGHEEMADRLMVISGLGDLDVPDLEYLCRRYDVEFVDILPALEGQGFLRDGDIPV